MYGLWRLALLVSKLLPQLLVVPALLLRSSLYLLLPRPTKLTFALHHWTPRGLKPGSAQGHSNRKISNSVGG